MDEENKEILLSKKTVKDFSYYQKKPAPTKPPATEYDVMNVPGTGGAIPMPYDYIIYIDTATIKALNCNTGVVDYQGADPTTVINSCINACGASARIYVKIGTYTFTDPIISGNRSLIIDCEGIGYGPFITPTPGVMFRPDVGFTDDFLFKFGAADRFTYGSGIKNCIIDGRTYATHPGAIQLRNVACANFENVNIIRFRDTTTPGTGITITGNAAYGSYWNTFKNIIMHDCVRGVYYDSSYANANMFIGGYFRNSQDNPAYGMVFEGACDTCEIYGTDFSFYSQANSVAIWIKATGGSHHFTGARFEGNTKDILIDNGTGASFFMNCNITSVVTDNSAYPSQFIGCKSYYTIRRGYTAISDGGTIAHGLDVTPVGAQATCSVVNEICAVTALDATNITVAIKKRSDGSAGTNQTIYWIAYGSGSRY